MEEFSIFHRLCKFALSSRLVSPSFPHRASGFI